MRRHRVLRRQPHDVHEAHAREPLAVAVHLDRQPRRRRDRDRARGRTGRGRSRALRLDLLVGELRAASCCGRSGRRPCRCSRRRSARPGGRDPGTARSLRSPTVWPRWMSGAVGSNPCLTRSGRPSRARSAQALEQLALGQDLLGAARSADLELLLGRHGDSSDAGAHRETALGAADDTRRDVAQRGERRRRRRRRATRGSTASTLRPDLGSSDRGVLDRLGPSTRAQPAVRAAARASPGSCSSSSSSSRSSAPRAPCSASSGGSAATCPTPEQLTAIQPPVKTVVYDARGRVLHEFYKENRSPVPLKQIPRHLVNATHLDRGPQLLPALGRRPVGHRRAPRSPTCCTCARAEGGSTITQQLARNLFLTHERTLTRKLKEIALAIEIERNYSKDQILEMYFNQIYFGEGAYGVEAAAKTYFGKPLARADAARVRAARRAAGEPQPLLAAPPAGGGARAPRQGAAQHARHRARSPRSSSTTRSSAPLGVTPHALQQRPRALLRRDGAAPPRRAATDRTRSTRAA